jgi:PAS domain S-box-containing protein
MLATKRKPADRVLVVNDMPDQVGIMKVLLEKSGYSVLTAFDGRQALETAEQSLPDIIISDVSMPRMNGIELCTAIRNHPQLRSIPVLLVSANCKDSESVVRGLRSGADDYLEAPYDPMRLVVKAAHLIENRRADEKIRESEARFRSLAETATDVILTVDSEGKILFINSSVERVFGYSTEELTGELVALIIPEYLQQVATVGIENESDPAREPLCCEAVEVAGRHKSGYEVPLEVSFGEFVKDGNSFYTGIARDITARKQAEERLSRSEERLRLAQQAGDIGVFDWNMNTGQLTWTTELEALFGLAPGTFEGTMEHWRRHIHPDDLRWTDESLQTVIGKGTRDWHEEYRILRAETQESRWIDVFGQFFYDEIGTA